MKSMGSSIVKELRRTTDLTKWGKDQQREALKDIFVYSPEVNNILEMIEGCRVDSKRMSSPKCAYVRGESGVGKSFLLKQYLKKFTPYDKKLGTDIQRIVPVLYVRITPNSNGTSISQRMRAELGDPLYATGKNTDHKLRITENLLKDCRVELVILDELQHIIERESEKIIREAADWIKILIENTGIPFVLVGLPSLTKIFEDNEQLKSRFKKNRTIKPFSYSGAKEIKRIRTFLDVVDDCLPLLKRSNFSDEYISNLLCSVTEGRVRPLMEAIIQPAALKAIDLSLHKISYGLLEDEIKEFLDEKEVERLRKHIKKRINNEKKKQKNSKKNVS